MDLMKFLKMAMQVPNNVAVQLNPRVDYYNKQK